MDDLSYDAVAAATGTPVENLADWVDAGVIGRSGSTTLSSRDVELVHLVNALVRRGATQDSILEVLIQQSGLVESFLARLAPSEGPVPTVGSMRDDIGLEDNQLERFLEAVDASATPALLRSSDLGALRTMRAALDAGLPEDALIQLVRVYAESFARIADAEVRLFHMYVHEQLRSGGLPAQELQDRTEEISASLQRLMEPGLRYFHDVALRHAFRDDLVVHVAAALGLGDRPTVPGELRRAVAFVDLSGFTPLTSAMGDASAAHVLERFAVRTRAVVARHGGKVVKQIGDGFLLVFDDPASAVRAVLELDVTLGDEPRFPALHAGVHYGSVLYRDGDYVGATVNTAARLVDEAGRHEVVVTEPVIAAAGAPSEEVVDEGTRELRGLGTAVKLFRIRSPLATDAARRVDPVCGMELDPSDVAATVVLCGETHAFCSTECLRIFVDRSARCEPGLA